MSPLEAWVQGVALLGPGLTDWESAGAILRKEHAWECAPTQIPPPAQLPAAERRRTGTVIKLALHVGLAACRAAAHEPKQLSAVFTSSGSDGENCHEICSALASADRTLSPTRFHNSVHNAAAGYWGIATGAMRAANALCAYDASFAAGLLEALVLLCTERTPVLLVAYDATYPPPLRVWRPIPDAFALALVLTPEPGADPLGHLAVCMTLSPPTRLTGPLEDLRGSIPAARALPLLAALAARGQSTAVLEYLSPQHLEVRVNRCR